MNPQDVAERKSKHPFPHFMRTSSRLQDQENMLIKKDNIVTAETGE